MVDRNRDALSPDPVKPGIRTARLAAGVVLALAAPQALFAASNLGSGCDSVARVLQSVDIPVETLTVDIVDHMPEDHGVLDPVIGHEHDPTAPLLFLTPRVAHIMQDVFSDTDRATDGAEPEATPMERVRRIMLAVNAAAKAQAPQSVPAASTAASTAGGDGDAGAETDSGGDPMGSSGPLTETFYDVDTLPRFQQRMYRNDI